MQNLFDSYDAAHDNGGFTFNLLSNATVKKGFAVASFGREHTLPVNSAKESFLIALFLYIAQNTDVLRRSAVLGCWVHKRRVYFDCVQVVSNKESAVALARVHGEKSVFDLTNGTKIMVG